MDAEPGRATAADLGEAWQRALEANVRYYEALSRLSLDYLRTLAGVVGDVRLPPLRLPLRLGDPPAAPGGRPAAPPAPPGDHDGGHAPPAASPPAMVLEAEGGREAVGVFLVENQLGHPVTATVTASSFTADDGRGADVHVVFDPSTIALDPGEQVLVRVTVTVPDDVEPGVSYRGEASVPDLLGTRVPLVLRRRP